MQLKIEAEGIGIDAHLNEFVNTTVAFATWRHDLEIHGVTAHLDHASDEGGDAFVRCLLRADTAAGRVCAGATGSDPCLAVQGAADLLEAELHRPRLDVLSARRLESLAA